MSRPYRPAYERVPTKVLGAGQLRMCLISNLYLVGKLQQASKVIRSGQTFLWRMFELSKGTSKQQNFICLNTSFRSYLMWWNLFLESWNGISMSEDPAWKSVPFHLYTDTSGSFGCGAWSDQSWFQYSWPNGLKQQSIAAKELLPIVMACMVWGKTWSKYVVSVHCDNQAVVEVVNAGYCKDPHLMQLLWCLFFSTTFFKISVKAAHIAGRRNTRADALYRNNMHLFFSQVPTANKTLTLIPTALIKLLIHQQPDWTSQAWSRPFTNCLRQV